MKTLLVGLFFFTLTPVHAQYEGCIVGIVTCDYIDTYKTEKVYRRAHGIYTWKTSYDRFGNRKQTRNYLRQVIQKGTIQCTKLDASEFGTSELKKSCEALDTQKWIELDRKVSKYYYRCNRIKNPTVGDGSYVRKVESRISKTMPNAQDCLEAIESQVYE